MCIRDRLNGVQRGDARQNAFAPAAKACHHMVGAGAQGHHLAAHRQGVYLHPGAPAGGTDVHKVRGLSLIHILDGLLAQFQQELGGNARVVATGSLPPPVRRACRTSMEYIGGLILDGLYAIWLKNQK